MSKYKLQNLDTNKKFQKETPTLDPSLNEQLSILCI